MNKLLQTTLITAIMATSGMATSRLVNIADLQQGGTINGSLQIDENVSMQFDPNIVVSMKGNAVIHNYGTIQGPATTTDDGTEIRTDTILHNGSNIDNLNKETISNLPSEKKASLSNLNNLEAGSEKIINYDHIMEQDTNIKKENLNYYRPTGGGKIQGAIDTTEIPVISQAADLKYALQKHNEDTDVMLLRTNCSEKDKIMHLTNSDQEQKIINASIANSQIDKNDTKTKSHSLVVRGDFEFKGDQSNFNQGKVTFLKSNSLINNSNALFQTPINLFCKSSLTIGANVEVQNNITVENSQLIIAPNATLRLKSGTILRFQKAPDYPNNPLQTTWLDGSFAKDLTPLYVNTYLLPFKDRTNFAFYYNEYTNTWSSPSGDISAPPESLLKGLQTEGLLLRKPVFNKTEDGNLEIKCILSASLTIQEDGTLMLLNGNKLLEPDKDNTYTVPLVYDQTMKIRKNTDTNSYETTTEDYIVSSGFNNRIHIESKDYIKIATLDESSQQMNLKSKDVICYKDDVFSYYFDEDTDCWVRTARYMIFPQNFDISSLGIKSEDANTWRIFKLPEGVVEEVQLLGLGQIGSENPKTYFSVINSIIDQNISIDIYSINNSNKLVRAFPHEYLREGNKTVGTWALNTNTSTIQENMTAAESKIRSTDLEKEVGNNTRVTIMPNKTDKNYSYLFSKSNNKILAAIDENARNQQNNSIWMTLEQYNTENRTTYEWNQNNTESGSGPVLNQGDEEQQGQL